jgi:CBS-domain-containing membrane protein
MGARSRQPGSCARVWRVRASAPVEGLIERLQDPKGAALYVTDAAGKIIGLLTRQALGEVMMIRAARPDWRFERKV